MINILMCGNDKVAGGLLVSILSYVKHNKEAVTYFFMTMDLTDLDPAYKPLSPKKAEYLDKLLKEGNKDSSLVVLDCRKVYLDYLAKSKNTKNMYTPYAQLRLFSDLFPQIPDKILYLDTDTLIAKDISEFYHMDMSDYEYFAARDLLGRNWINEDYQNSGVLLLNMKEIRKNNFFANCRSYVATHKSMLPDQDAMNKYVKKKYYLSMDYNNQGQPSDTTIIKHFSKTIIWLPFFHLRNIKPWQVEQIHEVWGWHMYDDVLDDYVKREAEFKAL